MAANHDPSSVWDPMVDYSMMSRNVRAFMTLLHCSKPVVCKVHGFCVAGGTDMALCSDLLVIAADAKIGYPPARVWGSPTTALWAYRLGAQRAKRLLFTGDSLSGTEALEWGLAIEAPGADRLDERAEALVTRIARMPVNQLQMMKLLVNESLHSQGLHATQTLGTVFDGIARHTREGYAFQAQAAGEGFRAAVRDRDRAVRRSRPLDLQGVSALEATTATTRDRLLAAAQELIEEGGYGATSVIAIAERAGVAAGTLYRHFASRQELFVDLFRSVCAREERAMQAAAAAAGADVGHRASRDGSRHVRTPCAAQPAARVGADRRAVDPLRRRRAAGIQRAIRGADRRGSARGDRDGELPVQNVELTAAALVGGCGEALVGPLSPVGRRRGPAAAEIVEALRTFVRRAVGAA